jgi:HSP20 family molecular chaperone IbpA
MKKYILPSLIFFIGLALGVGGSHYYNKRLLQGNDFQLMEEIPNNALGGNMDDFFDDIFDDEFFRDNRSPFKQIEKMKERMNKLFKNSFEDFSSNNIFDVWYKNKFGGKVGDIKQFEDKTSIYYKVHLPQIDKKNVKIDVRNGMVNISAKSEKVIEEKKKGVSSKSSFKQTLERRFPVPSNANQEKVDFNFEGDNLVIHFIKNNDKMRGSYDV